MSYLINLSLFKRNRNFSLLFIGQFISFMGTKITDVALPFQIYTLTHSTLMVGLLSLFQLLPLLFTALIGGVFADRYHRRMLLLAAESVLGVGSLVLAWNASLAHPQIWILFIVSACMSAFNGLHRPALESMIQQIVPKEDFIAVSSLASVKGGIAMIGGPAIGGLIIAKFGIVATYLTDVSTFIISLSALVLMTNIPKPPLTQDISTWTALKEGWSYAMSRQELVGSYLVDFIAMIFGMPMALFPAIALNYGGASALGILYSAPAVGAVIVSVTSGWAIKVKRYGRAIALAALGWGAAIIIFGLATHFWLAITFLAIAGGFDAISGIFRTTLWNESIPNHFRGRLAGIEMISYLSGPKLGDTEAGLVASVFGITASIVSGGVLCLFGVGICCYYLPKFWNFRSSST